MFAVDHLAPSTTYCSSVFTRDWSGASSAPVTITVRTPAPARRALTLRSPFFLTYGRSSSLTVTLHEDTGRPVPGARVQLLVHHTGERDRAPAWLTTEGAGRFHATRRTSENTRYTMRFAGNRGLTPAAAMALVQAYLRITLTLYPSGRVPLQTPAFVTATVAPAFPGGPLATGPPACRSSPTDREAS